MAEDNNAVVINQLNGLLNSLWNAGDIEELVNCFSKCLVSGLDVKPVAIHYSRHKGGQCVSIYLDKLDTDQREKIHGEVIPLFRNGGPINTKRPAGNETSNSHLKTADSDYLPMESAYCFLYSFETAESIYVISAEKKGALIPGDSIKLKILQILCGAFLQKYSFMSVLDQPGSADIQRLQEELTHSENRLAFVLNTVADGIFTFNPDNLIIMANREAEKIWGYEPGTLEGVYVHKLLEENENAPAALINFLLNPSGQSEILGKTIEFVGFRKNRTKFPLEAKIQGTVLGGRQYFTAAVTDITERKKILADLVAAKNEAEESTRVKEEFLAHISHEIRTPLNTIIGYTSLLLQANPKGETREYLSSIKISADNLSLLINDVLDISRIRAGKIELTNYQFNLTDVFERIYHILSGPADEKNLSMTYDIDSAISFRLIGDAVRLSQVLLNLTANAVKYTSNGSVFYSAELIKENGEECVILFRVKDTGVGIPEDKQKSIFKSFTRIPSSGGSTSGSGLGLTIANELVKIFGGEISVHSTPGMGSTFSFKLKMQKYSEKNEVNKPYGFNEHYMADLERIKILLVEDNKLNAAVIEKLFQKWNAVYKLAVNGSEAVAALQKEPFDIILMDIAMPVLNGYDATRMIRNTFPEPVRSIPIVGLTASAFLEDKSKMMDAGMNDYITKPFQPVELISKIIKCTGLGKIVNQDGFSGQGGGSADRKNDNVVINLDYLYQAFNLDPKGLYEFISDVLQQVPETLELFNDLCYDLNVPDIKKTGHKMKSVFRYLGMDQISNRILDFENISDELITKNKVNELNSALLEAWNAALPELLAEQTRQLKKIKP